jgi:uncharacterized membrane protein YhaH (DUF805 family)
MEAIDWGSLLFSFEGRINRAKFWAGVVVIWIVMAVLAAIAYGVDSSGFWVVYYIVAIAAIWPSLAIYIKRWHDRGKSGWWVLIVFIPLIGSLWLLIECGFLRGDDGANEYGPDPLATA